MFPERSDRIVLDSNIGDTHLDRDGMRRYALGMEQTFPDFAKWAAARHDSYGLGRTPAQVSRTFFTLAEQLDKVPVAGFDGNLLRLYTFGNLFKKLQYPKLAQQLQTLTGGSGSDGDGGGGSEKEARLPLSQNATADETPPSFDNSLSVFLAVTCNDIKWPENVDTYRQGVAKDRERYPLFGAATANITPCAFWPYAPAEQPVAINDDGPRNVLVVQNLRDGSTPHLGGDAAREVRGPIPAAQRRRQRARCVRPRRQSLRAEHHHALPRRGRDAQRGHALPRGLIPGPVRGADGPGRLARAAVLARSRAPVADG